MPRLLVIVEGETEERFVNDLLRHHLVNACGYCQVAARLMGNARQRSRRGGIRGWQDVRRDVIRHLQEDAGRYVTTFVDYYALPQGDDNPKAWPGRTAATKLPHAQKGPAVERAIAADIGSSRFLPFVVMHEFEALLFSDPARCAKGMRCPALESELSAIRLQFCSPEEINDSPISAPSKRLETLFERRGRGRYEKPLFGNLAAMEIGLPAMRQECPHFGHWVQRLEALGSPAQ